MRSRVSKRQITHTRLAQIVFTVLVLGGLIASLGCSRRLPAALADEATPEASQPRLIAARVSALPRMDGEIEKTWNDADPLVLPLQWGFDGTEHALDVTLRSVYTDAAVAFLATWAGESPPGDPSLVRNRVVVHWPIPMPENGKSFNCMVACHTAFADGTGQFTYIAPETIPPGTSGSLPVGGGWDGQSWTMEWSRPLQNKNPYDLQFTDLDTSYRFFVKLLQHVQERPDPVSEWCLLEFGP